MKKIAAIMLAVMMCLGLAACSGGGGESGSGEPQELKLVDSGYSFIDNYIYYAVIVENPNEGVVVGFPTVRITAKDADGNVLGTTDAYLGEVHAGQTVEHASIGFEVSEAPASVDFEVLPFDEYDITAEGSSEHANMKKLTTTGVKESVDEYGYASYTGEIVNENDYDFSGVEVTVLYRDENGKLIGGEYTYVEHVAANGNTPFSLEYVDGFDYDSWEIFVNPSY